MLHQPSLAGKYPLLFLLLILGSSNLYAQYFDSLIFRTSGLYWKESVIYMGDQNGDGCDDFLITKMDTTAPDSEGKAYFYYGGNPVPDTPAFYIKTYNPITITACDINRDGFRDVIRHRGVINTYPVSYDVFLGGPYIDTIPDFVIYHPDSNHISILFGRDWPIDFDGDGWEEFVTISYSWYFYFLIATPNIQPVEYYVLKPDSAYANYRLWWNYISFADIDGDGKTDVSPMLSRTDPTVDLRRFYYGNSDFSFSNYYQFSSDTTFQPQNIFMVNDMNGNGNGELIVFRGTAGGDMPYALSFGTRPPNITPEVKISAGGLSGGGVSPGDVNGDGYGDLLKYIPYDSYALYLGGRTITGLIAKLYVSNYFNRDIDFAGRVGDINGDGIDDICVGENGYEEHSILPGGDIYIYKGTRTPVSVEEEADSRKKSEELALSVSPNPTNGLVAVNSTLPESGDLMIEVFNILGERIYSSSSPREKGAVSEKIDLTRRAGTSGVYIVRTTLTTPGKTYSKSVKVQVVK